jgi:hypothetical protein
LFLLTNITKYSEKFSLTFVNKNTNKSVFRKIIHIFTFKLIFFYLKYLNFLFLHIILNFKILNQTSLFLKTNQTSNFFKKYNKLNTNFQITNFFLNNLLTKTVNSKKKLRKLNFRAYTRFFYFLLKQNIKNFSKIDFFFLQTIGFEQNNQFFIGKNSLNFNKNLIFLNKKINKKIFTKEKFKIITKNLIFFKNTKYRNLRIKQYVTPQFNFKFKNVSITKALEFFFSDLFFFKYLIYKFEKNSLKYQFLLINYFYFYNYKINNSNLLLINNFTLIIKKKIIKIFENKKLIYNPAK